MKFVKSRKPRREQHPQRAKPSRYFFAGRIIGSSLSTPQL